MAADCRSFSIGVDWANAVGKGIRIAISSAMIIVAAHAGNRGRQGRTPEIRTNLIACSDERPAMDNPCPFACKSAAASLQKRLQKVDTLFLGRCFSSVIALRSAVAALMLPRFLLLHVAHGFSVGCGMFHHEMRLTRLRTGRR